MPADDLCGAQGSTAESPGDPACRVVPLKSSTLDVAILSSLGVLPFLLFSLPAGVVVDRLAKHKLMMWCDIGRLLLLASIPPATLPGLHLTFALPMASPGWGVLLFVGGTFCLLRGSSSTSRG
ncbi:hypothetical protein AB0D59_42935 [Streptomyces sp. NPDC048417]|uniref:hypothetical protein n=1 Tax=Streptomyces sp. NPDC048417 TaxID=3155387 RepID=UPI003437114C